MKGIIPVEDLSSWYKTWNQKIVPNNVRVMGGEPLLHPDIVEIIRMTRNDWPDSSVELLTNGLMIAKMQEPFFSVIRENGVNVLISHHFDDPEFNRIFDAGVNLLKFHGIEPHVLQCNWFWAKSYRLNEVGQAVPFRSIPEKAWQNCFVKGYCTTLLDNKLYCCPQLGCAAYARKMGYIGADWDIVFEYQPLLPECSHEELESFIHQGGCQQCCICPEVFEYADMYQKLNVFGLHQFKKIFCGECHESH